MYIEQLTENDFKKFADIFDCSVAKIKTTENNGVYLQLFTEAMSELSDRYITEAINYKGKQKEKHIFYYVKKYAFP